MRSVLNKNNLIVFLIFSTTSCTFNRFFYFNYTPYHQIEDNNYEELYLIASNQKKINAIIMTPGAPAKGYILLMHGNGGNISTWYNRVKPLVEYGYKVLLFDYQGFGKSEGAPSHKNLIADSQMFLNYVVKNNNEGLKVILMGFSMGGNLAVELARRNQNIVDALVIEGSFNSHQEIALKYTPKFLKPIAKLTIASPYKSSKAIKEITNMPKLIIHSYDDKVCPIEMGDIIYNNAKEPKLYWKINESHCKGLIFYKQAYLANLDALIAHESPVSTVNNIKK